MTGRPRYSLARAAMAKFTKSKISRMEGFMPSNP